MVSCKICTPVVRQKASFNLINLDLQKARKRISLYIIVHPLCDYIVPYITSDRHRQCTEIQKLLSELRSVLQNLCLKVGVHKKNTLYPLLFLRVMDTVTPPPLTVAPTSFEYANDIPLMLFVS